jgi:hypothetical protein
LQNAAKELGEKYAEGHVSIEDSVDAPTGDAYKHKYANELKEKQEKKLKKESERRINENQKNAFLDKTNESNSDGEDADDDKEEDGDYELRLLREQRLRQIKNAHKQKVENVGKGHGTIYSIYPFNPQILTLLTLKFCRFLVFSHAGQYREIVQDEFIKEMTSSDIVVRNCYFCWNFLFLKYYFLWVVLDLSLLPPRLCSM